MFSRTNGAARAARCAGAVPSRFTRAATSRLSTAASGVLFALALALVAPPAFAAGRVISLRADDGRTVSATLFEAARLPAPAVVLVPALGHSHDEWQAVAQKLNDAGMTGLAIDLPGTALPDDPKQAAAWSGVVRAGVGYLAVLSSVRASAIGAAGASLGASLAAAEAATDPRVRALALVSPSLDYRGVRMEGSLRQFGSRPALLLASRRDAYAARSVRELAKDAPGPRETYFGEAPAHGFALLSGEPELVRTLVEWFQRTLAVN